MNEEKKIHTEVVDIDDLIQDDKNFNKGTEEGAELIGRSFKEHGAGRSVFIDKNNRLVGGNKAQIGFKGAGYRKVVIVDSDPDTLVAVRRKDVDLDTKQGREMALLDNLTTQVNLAWDESEIESVSAEVEGFDIADFGFDLGFPPPPDEADKVKEDDFDPDEHYETKVKTGEVWQLGEHRLMCGDSTSEEDFAKLMGEERADMVFTDPPYNVEIVGGSHALPKTKRGGQRIMNDKWDSDEQAGQELWLPAFTRLRESSKDQCAIYVTMPQGGTHMMMMMMMAQAGWQVKHEIIWRKNSLVLGRQDYNYQHEPICYGWNKTHKFVGRGKFAKTSVWDIDRPTKSKEHPTMKPVELVAECMLDNSEEGDIVLDAFGGSGTTIIACEQLGRKARLMELDPHYCDVIIARWEKLTGGKAVKIEG